MLLSIFLNLCYGFSNLSLSGTGHFILLACISYSYSVPCLARVTFPPHSSPLRFLCRTIGRLDIQLRLGQFLKQAR